MDRKLSDEPVGSWVAVLAVLLGFAALSLFAAGAFGAELPRKGKIAAPPAQQTYIPPTHQVGAPEQLAYKAHNFYVGGVAGYSFGTVFAEDDGYGKTFASADDTWQAGIVAGYLWRSEVLGLGIEADWVVRDLAEFALDDGTASLRGRAGVFLAGGAFVYGTAGVAQAYSAEAPAGLKRGLVVGGGVERDVVANVAVRAEVLHYRSAGDYLEWGDEGSTTARAGLLFKF